MKTRIGFIVMAITFLIVAQTTTSCSSEVISDKTVESKEVDAFNDLNWNEIRGDWTCFFLEQEDLFFATIYPAVGCENLTITDTTIVFDDTIFPYNSLESNQMKIWFDVDSNGNPDYPGKIRVDLFRDTLTLSHNKSNLIPIPVYAKFVRKEQPKDTAPSNK